VNPGAREAGRHIRNGRWLAPAVRAAGKDTRSELRRFHPQVLTIPLPGRSGRPRPADPASPPSSACSSTPPALPSSAPPSSCSSCCLSWRTQPWHDSPPPPPQTARANKGSPRERQLRQRPRRHRVGALLRHRPGVPPGGRVRPCARLGHYRPGRGQPPSRRWRSRYHRLDGVEGGNQEVALGTRPSREPRATVLGSGKAVISSRSGNRFPASSGTNSAALTVPTPVARS
jgi:hypothetical protein